MSIHAHPYGVGLAYRYHLHEEVLHYASDIDLLEIPTEDHIIRRRALSYPGAEQKFAQVLELFPCVAHGISMSIGSLEPADPAYLKRTRKFLLDHGLTVFSEHLAYHRMDGRDISSFLGMPLRSDSLSWLEQSYNYARDYLGRDFALENVSLSFTVSDGEFSEPEFLRQFLERTGATLLLDVTNMFNNCTNYNQDPYEFLHSLPPDRISQLHLAGGHYDENGFLVDSHSFAVMDEVWDLYRETISYTQADVVILERDYQCFPFREVMEDIRKAREIFYDLRPATQPTKAASAAAEVADANLNGDSPDHTTAEFSDLRSFQRSVIKAITDDEFRVKTAADPQVAAEQFPMSIEWLSRFASCEKLDHMAACWKETDRLDREDEERFRQWEWSQWAVQQT